MAGGGSDNTGKKMLKWEKEQVALAEKREAERQARLKAGVNNINEMFDGAPVMGTRQVAYDWTKFNEAVARARQSSGSGSGVSTVGNSGSNSGSGSGGFTLGNLVGGMMGLPPGSINLGEGSGDNDPFAGVSLPAGYTVRTRQESVGSGRNRGTRTVYEIVGPNGQVYSPGSTLNYNEQYDTGARAGGFGDSFYKNYQDAYLSYYQPQVEDQYRDAKKQLNYGYGRAGTLKSSMAAESISDLFKDKLNNDAMVRSQADSAVGQLRNNVSDAKTAAISQLYATEDPTIASNLATNSIKGLTAQQPKFDPLGELFNVASVGAAGYINANSQRAASPGGYYGSPGTRSRTSTVG